jgi:arylsulfatase A-like enzyme
MYAKREIELRPNVPPDHRAQAVEDLRGYYAHIAALDDAWAMLEAAIEAAGIADDTIVVFTADHGDMMQSQGLPTKLFPWDESVRVPFLIRWGGRLSGTGATNPIPVDAPDVMPTLLGLCGLTIPDTVEGRDWSPVLLGGEQATGDEDALLIMAAEFARLNQAGMKAYRGLRNRNHTYVRNRDGPWLLFDNRADPYQMRNLVNRPEHAERRARLDRRLQERLDAMGDTFADSRTLLERAGLAHYGEANAKCRKKWTDPWATPG